MIELPPVCAPDSVGDRLGTRVVVWASPSVRARLDGCLPWPVLGDGEPVPPDIDGLVAAGGGTLIDEAKLLRVARPNLRLGALPTVWGSGAEASPIAVTDAEGGKRVSIMPALRPDLIILMPELGRSVPPERARHACGDAWAHALEGFFSPLATATLRTDLAAVMQRMLALPLAYADEWFTVSALACAGQAQASVGAVHGIAHTLEPVMRVADRETAWGHAKLCALFLLPVMRFNQRHNPKWPLLSEAGLSDDTIFGVIAQLFDPAAYAAALPSLKANWMTVLRDPCTRTNSSLVRPGDLAFFEAFHS